MIKTEIASVPANYERKGMIECIDERFIFDTSGGEYGPCEIPLWLLEEKLYEHRLNILKQIRDNVKRN